MRAAGMVFKPGGGGVVERQRGVERERKRVILGAEVKRNVFGHSVPFVKKKVLSNTLHNSYSL